MRKFLEWPFPLYRLSWNFVLSTKWINFVLLFGKKNIFCKILKPLRAPLSLFNVNETWWRGIKELFERSRERTLHKTVKRESRTEWMIQLQPRFFFFLFITSGFASGRNVDFEPLYTSQFHRFYRLLTEIIRTFHNHWLGRLLMKTFVMQRNELQEKSMKMDDNCLRKLLTQSWEIRSASPCAFAFLTDLKSRE